LEGAHEIPHPPLPKKANRLPGRMMEKTVVGQASKRRLEIVPKRAQ
jgi:hypothetical protein